MNEAKYTGRCFCGAVGISASGKPAAMGYCHCASCRSWSAAPVNAFTLWAMDSVAVMQGADKLATYSKTPASERQYCRACGGHVMTRHPGMGLIDVYAATLPALAFEPQIHVHYGEHTLPIRDGLPKFKDIPSAMGGTGTMLDE